mgnify:CR=1 FL=1
MKIESGWAIEYHSDRIEIRSKEPRKSTIIAYAMITPFFFANELFKWLGLGSADPEWVGLIIFFGWLLGVADVATSAGLHYRVDTGGVTRTFYNKHVVRIPWSEMKFIGKNLRGRWRYGEIVFSKVPLAEYRKRRLSRSSHALQSAIAVPYSEDGLYEKILEFSSGERDLS